MRGDVDYWARRAAESLAGHEGNGKAAGELPEMSADDVATVDDLIRAGSEVRWAWELWIPIGVLTALAAPAGTGKTRFCCDLLRRIRHGLPWPDGREITLPPDSRSLWVVADNHHDQLVELAVKWGLADVLRLNASKSDPYGGVILETVEDYLMLEARVKAVRPAFVFIDTVGNSTDKSLSRQEDAKAYYQPLQVMARRHACAVVCVTHLNATGQFLGRRVLEKVRVALKLEKFKGEKRLRLEAPKSFAREPAPLGVTMGDDGSEYDTDPPEAPEEGGGFSGRPSGPPQRVRDASDWLRDFLKHGARRVSMIRDAAEDKGITAGSLYRAKEFLGLEEYESEGRKWWRLTTNDLEEDY